MQQIAQDESSLTPSHLVGVYLTDGTDLFYVKTHTMHGFRLENCLTNMETYYSFAEFQQLGVLKAVRPS